MNVRLILYLVGLGAFVASLGQNFYSPLLVQVQESLHTSAYMANLSVTVFTVALAVMQVVYGPLADKKGRKTVLLPAFLLYIAATIGCAYAHSIGALLVFRLLQGAGSAALPVIAAAIIGDICKGSELARGMATYQLILMLAPALGPLFGGLVGQRLGISVTFLSLAAISIAVFAANAFFLRETKPDTAQARPFGIRQFGVIFRNKASAAILLAGFAQCLAYFVFLVFLPQILYHRYTWEAGSSGSILLVMSLFTMVSVKLGGWLSTRWGKQKSFLYTFCFHALTVMLSALTADLSIVCLIIDACLFGIGMGLTMSLPVTMLAELFPTERATAIGVYNLVRYLGMALGPLLGSLLYSGGSSVPLFLVSGLLYLGALAWCALLLKARTSGEMQDLSI